MWYLELFLYLTLVVLLITEVRRYLILSVSCRVVVT